MSINEEYVNEWREDAVMADDLMDEALSLIHI